MVLRVLLVDDDEGLTGVAKVFLEKDKDLKVDTSSSAKKALEKLKSDNYDVIVADYQMPEMNGIELLRKLRSEDNATPFILFTGRGREDVAIDALNSGASFYLQKGGDPRTEFAELANMIKRSARHAQIEKAHAELMVDLQKSRRLLITTLESTTDGILGFDREGNVLVYNNRFLEIWGIPEQAIKSRNWDQIMPYMLDRLKDPNEFINETHDGFTDLSLQNRSLIEFRDGRVFDYISSPMHVNGEAVGRIANFRDMTNQVLAEGALRREKDKAQQYLSLAGVMLLALDEYGKVTLVNKRGCEILGYEEGQILGKSWFENFLPENLRDETRIVFKGLMQGDLKSFEHRSPIPVLCRDGGERYITFTNSLLKNERGEVIGTLSSGEDVTERLKADEALKKSEAKFAVAFNSSPEMMVIGSLKDGRLVDVNESFVRGTGHTREAVLGRTITEIGWVTEAERDRVRSVVEEKGSVQGLEIHDRTKSGADRITLLSAAAISIEGEPCMMVIISDITATRRAEQAASETELRFQSFMNHLPAVCYMVDTSDRYVYTNKVFEELTGISVSDIVGKSVYDVWPPNTAEFFAKTHQVVFSSQTPLELVESVQVKNETREFLSLKFPVPALAGSSKILGGVSLDITEQRRVEKALRHVNKKLELLGSVTRHDAINQLSVLMAWLDIAMEVGKDLPTMEQLTKAQEAAIMLQAQLEFTAEYQEMGLKEPQWTDLRAAAYAGVESLDLGAVSLKIDTKGIEVYADPMLSRVFHNLVDNSLRYGEKVTQIRLYLQESGGGLIVVCEDDGVGISVGEKEKIFVRGYGKHTGLGLYLAREILELTGIEIRETGEPGKGARFELLVPVGNYRAGSVS